MSFQENLKHYREKAGYKSAKEFANTLGIPPNTYVGYEVRGREPKFDTLCKIADLLEVSTDDLLGRTSNILGNKEDKRLKKLLDEIFLLNKTTSAYFDIEINNIDKDFIYLLVKLKCNSLIFNVDINKNDFINSFNKLKNQQEEEIKYFFKEYIQINIINEIITGGSYYIETLSKAMQCITEKDITDEGITEFLKANNGMYSNIIKASRAIKNINRYRNQHFNQKIKKDYEAIKIKINTSIDNK